MKIGQRRIVWSVAIFACALLAGIVLLWKPPAARPIFKEPERSLVDVPSPSPSLRPGTSQPEATKSETPNSVAELTALIREFSARGGDAAALSQNLVGMRLTEKAWWRGASDFSALRNLTTDAALDEHFRNIAMRLYLAGAPDAELKKNADSVQRAAMAAEDDMVSAVLQGMAERSLPPESLIRYVLNAQDRGVGAQCYAWYAARLTNPRSLEYATRALSVTEHGFTEASKVAFDYLAGTSFASDLASSHALQQKIESHVADARNVPESAGAIEIANSDAFIRAIPSIMGAQPAMNTLFSLLEEASNPEMRLSALEQLVKLHLTGEVDLSNELHDIRNRVGELFSDPAKQVRAKVRLNRISKSAEK